MPQETGWLAACLPSVVYADATRNLMGPILNLRRIIFFMSLPVAVIATAAVDVRAQNSTARLVGQPVFEDAALEITLKTEALTPPLVITAPNPILVAEVPAVEPVMLEPVVADVPVLRAASTKGTALAQGSTIIRGSDAAGVQPREALAESVQAALTRNP
jgi:hypothetical protein